MTCTARSRAAPVGRRNPRPTQPWPRGQSQGRSRSGIHSQVGWRPALATTPITAEMKAAAATAVNRPFPAIRARSLPLADRVVRLRSARFGSDVYRYRTASPHPSMPALSSRVGTAPPVIVHRVLLRHYHGNSECLAPGGWQTAERQRHMKAGRERLMETIAGAHLAPRPAGTQRAHGASITAPAPSRHGAVARASRYHTQRQQTKTVVGIIHPIIHADDLKEL